MGPRTVRLQVLGEIRVRRFVSPIAGCCQMTTRPGHVEEVCEAPAAEVFGDECLGLKERLSRVIVFRATAGP